MRKQLLLALLIVVSKILAAQTGNRDSVKQLLQNDKEDTSRVLHLADLSFEYIESKPDTMMILALQALSLANRIGFEKGKAISLNRVGNAYSSFGNYSKSMQVLLQALQINEKINNVDGKERNLVNIGLIYVAQEDYRQALAYLFLSKSLGEKINNKEAVRALLSTYVNIASAYDSLKIFDSATLYAEQTKAIAYKINHPRLIASSLAELGSINFKTGQNTLALEYYRLSIPYSKEAKNDLRSSQTFLDMANVFQKLNQIDSVLFYARLSMAVARENGFTKEIRDAGRFLTSYYRQMGKVDSAFFYLDITKIANGSMFSKQKQRQFQSLAFDEKLRQQESAAVELKNKEERRHDLQDAIIVIGLITFVILFLLLSRSIIVKAKFIEFFGILGLLAVFEFINLFIHPYLSRITSDSHFLMLGVLIAIGALLIPLHHKLEKWITKIMVEKNKKIRLEAAKKTIQQLEG